MKKIITIAMFFCMTLNSNAQRLLNWLPEFGTALGGISITMDATKGNQALLNSTEPIYVHIGVITNLSTSATDWRHATNWLDNSTNYTATNTGTNKWTLTIANLNNFFGIAAGETIQKIAILFRNATGTIVQRNSDGSDMFVPVYGSSEFAVRLNTPASEPRYVPFAAPLNIAVGGSVSIAGVSSTNAALTLKLDGAIINTQNAVNAIAALPTINTACQHQIMLEGNDGNTIKKDSFSFYITPTTNVAALPTGAVEGINYAANNTSATLVLYAPNKNNVTLIGDFSNWATLCTNQMNKTPDGNYYWITINGLTPGVEYGYQYVVDNTIKIADPYSQKILDPNNDQYINTTTYPNLKPYPTGLTTDLVSVLQTAETQYNWQATNFVKPNKKNLIVYELLVRDFTAQHSYQSLIDSFQYFKNLGINAIELMPINEFDGNDSWGYNPAFYFAPDKYYGTKNKLKEFIDKCHLNGIAVILDVVYNHCSGNAPEAKLYWDAANSRPATNNPWLNPVAPHPYSVFNDFNHTSTATQYLVQRSLNHWLEEYKVDGFRFDLAKGFTQTLSNTTTVENYDASRVANLERYYDATIANHPTAYMILEFLGTLPCQEEQEYANHGFMLWGNNNAVYNQCTMGYNSNSDISPIIYTDLKKAFSNPAEVGYMESHDEERTMYKNLTYGNAIGSYSIKNLATALAREEAAASVFFTTPGPKMMWMFEERGYDITLAFGGSNVTAKPPHWEYMTEVNRKHLYDTYTQLINLRLNNLPVFNSSNFTYDFYNNGGLVKLFQIADTTSNGKKITVLANLDITVQTKSVSFQTLGDWTNFISNGTGTGVNGAAASLFTLTNTTQNITLQPGEYHVYIGTGSSTPVICTTPVQPTILATTNITSTAVTLNWAAIAGLYYTLDYKPTNSNTWINATSNSTSNTITINNLTATTTYDFRVSASCNTTATTNYATAQFTTASNINPIQNLKDGYGIRISPNPIKQIGVVDYIVPNNGDVNIMVYTPNGKKVQTFYQGNQNAGQYQLIITNQLNSLSNGLYFIKLEQNGKGNSTKVLKR